MASKETTKEINLFCDEHGYLGSSSYFGTLAWLAHIHLQTEGEHELSYSWGKEVTDQERMNKEIQPALGGETNCGISLPRDSSE